MKISVSSSVGLATPVELEVEPLQTVRQVVEKVAAAQAVDPNSISLVHKGEVLPMERTLKNCGIKDGEGLKAMPRDPEGGVGDDAPLSFSHHLAGGRGAFPGSDLTRNRIGVELRRVRDARLPLQPTTPFIWQGVVHGRGRWRNQNFTVEIRLPPDYPARPPAVRFLDAPRPPHPNINGEGFVCLNHLMHAWAPTQNLVSVYEDLEWLLEHPNYHNPLNLDAIRRPAWVRHLLPF